MSDSCTGGAATNDATCDGVDDDCDGETDEDYLASASVCGVGACATLGTKACLDGALVDICAPGVGAPDDATCDGVDDDCDGQTDEDYAPVATSCGTGACEAMGATICVGGAVVVDGCQALSAGASDASCDGIDDDCDGATDEDFVASATSCGEGACASVGVTSCVSGQVSDSCVAGAAATSDTTCDGVDDDCNGQTDDGYVSVSTSCGEGACAGGGATSCVDGEVQDSCLEGSPAGLDASCDGVDDDCNDATDEDFSPVANTCGVGACATTGELTCVAGQTLNSCKPLAPAPLDATCDGVDDDCSGDEDEDYQPSATTCGTGACVATGLTSCVAGAVKDSCTPGLKAPNDASCNGIDDDCDGETDEDFVGQATSCGVGACAATGTTSCVAGQVVEGCMAGTPAADDATCDGVDDDCNGFTDEGYVPLVTSCGVGACAATGATSCVDGEVSDSCTAGAPAADDASCNGVDDDCNGQTDEDYAPLQTSCGTGACAASGTTSCIAGVVSDSCTAGTPAGSDASCNGIDDDCNGQTDEDYVPLKTSCGTGACAASGTTSCIAGVVSDSCAAGTPAESDASCNGVDDDCNGQTDEGYVPTPTTCGAGSCAATGMLICQSGKPTDTCSPGTGSMSDATCDGVDDDCDGQTDEDYLSVPTSCGVGACASTGASSCVGGVVQQNCTAGTPAADDASCNGIDDDCNGQTDDGYLPLQTSCGTGACAASGSTSCVDAAVSDSCSAGTPAAADASCDGVDDDCDGKTDEDYVSVQTTCGTGACARAGWLVCEAGQTSDTCVAGPAAAIDASCDGVDDDCNGQTDEDYQPSATTCGVGACFMVGLSACVQGAVETSCSPGQPAPADATCDGIDDNCDGATDEGYLPVSTSCGIGQCTVEGELACVDGALEDTCTPGTPSCGDAECGDDGCGGSCGSCDAGSYCAKGFCFPEANCDGVECGPDGAGGSCGTCEAPLACQLAACLEGHCSYSVAKGSCVIGKKCYAAGDPNPANDCEVCNPSADPTGWSPATDGQLCGDGARPCATSTCKSGKCSVALRADFAACDDGSASSVGDWCYGGACTGWYQRSEPNYGEPEADDQFYAQGTSLAGGGAFGIFGFKSGTQLAVTNYESSLNGVTRTLGPVAQGEQNGLWSFFITQTNRLWAWVGGMWTSNMSAGSLVAAFPVAAKSYARYRAIAYTGPVGKAPARFVAAGRSASGKSMAVRSCNEATVCAASPCGWSCSDDPVAADSAAEFPVGAAWYGGEPILGANAGSDTSPKYVDILRPTGLKGAWTLQPSLRVPADGRRLEAFAAVSGGTKFQPAQWLIGAGEGGLFFVATPDTLVSLVPGLKHPAPTKTRYVAIATFKGRVFVLGSYLSGSERHHILVHASLATSPALAARWTIHELESGPENLSPDLGAIALREMVGLAADGRQMFTLGATIGKATGNVRHRHVWRWDLPPGGPISAAEYWDDVKGGVPKPWTVVDQGVADPSSQWGVDPLSGVIRETGHCYDVMAGAKAVEKRGTFIVDTKSRFGDGAIRVRVRPDDAGGFGVMYGVQDEDTYYRFSVDKERQFARLVRVVDGEFVTLAEKLDFKFADLGQWMVLEVERRGEHHVCRLDGRTLFEADDAQLGSGLIALYAWAMKGVSFDDVQIFEP
ncbi:MAG: hypothetical protein H6744_12405 [Deltaproteobacteria bacterium]|nr:hypothetical protein [Deltaproteobacteria bacterium]